MQRKKFRVLGFITNFDKEVFDAKWWLVNCEAEDSSRTYGKC